MIVEKVTICRVEEPLEQQVVANRVQLGDAQAVGDRTAGGRAPPGTDPDVLVAGVLDQVPGDDEVRRVPHRLDRGQLVLDALAHLGLEDGTPAHVGALVGERPQVLGIAVVALGQGELGQFRLGKLDLEIATLGHPQRVVAGHLHLSEQVAHLLGGLQVVVGPVEPETLLVGDQRAGLHAQQGVGVGAGDVVAVVGGQQRGPQPFGDLDQLGVGAVLFGDAVILDLDEQVVASEDVLEPPSLFEGRVEALVHQRLEDVAAKAAGGGDDALGVLRQQLPIEAGLVVVALEKRLRAQLDEVFVAGVVLGQQGQVVVELATAVDLASRVVDPSPPRRPLETAVVGHVGLGADDRVDALGLGLLVEVEHPVHVAVIGDAQARLAVGSGGGDDLADAGRAVEHRELGVLVEVNERGISHRPGETTRL